MVVVWEFAPFGVKSWGRGGEVSTTGYYMAGLA